MAVVAAAILVAYLAMPVLEAAAGGSSGPHGCLKKGKPGNDGNKKCPKPPPPNSSITDVKVL